MGRGTKNNHCSLTLFLKLTLLKEGRGTWGERRRTITAHSPCFSNSHYFRSDEERDRDRGKKMRGARDREHGTKKYCSLFTVHCLLFTIRYSLLAIRYSDLSLRPVQGK